MEKHVRKLQEKLGYADGVVFRETQFRNVYFAFKDGVLFHEEDDNMFIESYLKHTTIDVYYKVRGMRGMVSVDDDYLMAILVDGFGNNKTYVMGDIPKVTDEFWYIGSELAPVKFDNAAENSKDLYLMLLTIGNHYSSKESAERGIKYYDKATTGLRYAKECE